MEKEKIINLNFIKKISKITVKDICKEYKINTSNLWTGRCSKENVALVRKAYEAKIAKIREEELNEYLGN